MTSQEMHIAFRIGVDKIDSKVYANILDEEINYFLNRAQRKLVKNYFTGKTYSRISFEETEKRKSDLFNIVGKNTTLTESSSQTGVKEGGVFFDLPSNFWFAVQDEAEVNFLDCNDSESSQILPFFPITIGEYNIIKDDPFNRPIKESHGLRLLTDGMLEALTNNEFEIANYYLRYLRKPQDIIFKKPVSGGIPSGKLVRGYEYYVDGVIGDSISHNSITYQFGDTFVAVNSTYSVVSGAPEIQVNIKDCELSDEVQDEIIDEAVNLALEVIESPRFQTNTIKNIEKE